MKRIGKSALALLLVLVTGCAQLGIKSVPWPTRSAVHDREAVNFLRGTPSVGPELGEGLVAKPMAEDGRLVGLSVSGGGARAAAFALGVLSELQSLTTKDGSNALERIDFVSSNSGGSWGVAAYLADRASLKDPSYHLKTRVEHRLIPDFIAMSDGRVPCWSRAMRDKLIGGATYADIYSSANPVPLPRVFLNAALLPAHAPFVFNDDFIRYYQVERFGACRSDWTGKVAKLADLPLSFAAAASGTVPGFYHAFAETSLCAAGSSVSAASFCHPKRQGGPLTHLRLADGGLYDNIGYKSAYELMAGQVGSVPGPKRAMILVNAGTSTEFKTVARSSRTKSYLTTTATNGIFAAQDSTFERLYRPLFHSLGVDRPVLLDFYSVAGFRPDQAHLLEGLDELAFQAAYNVDCYVGAGYDDVRGRDLPPDPPDALLSFADLERRGGDCLAENFYRAGTLAKTTYKTDRAMFTILWQLGRLSVQMNREAILRAVD